MTNPKLKTALLKRCRFYSLSMFVLLILAQILAFAWFGFEWLTHFTLHGSILILFASFAFKRHWRYFLWAIACGVIIFALIPFSGSLKDKSLLKVIAYNMYFENPKKDTEIAFLLAQQADILALTEMGGTEWQKQLPTLQANYPFSCGHSIDSPFAMQLFSKQKPLSCEVHFIADIYPYIRAVLPNQRTIFVLHPPPPVNSELANDRLIYFQAAAQTIAAHHHAVLVVGDLNNTPYSPIYRRFTKYAQLTDALAHATPTWKPFFLPLDRVLYRHNKAVAKALPWQYSDHRAIAIEWE